MSENPEPARTRLGLGPRADRIVLVGALGLLSAVSPLATDMYLPSMPEMARWFDTPASMVQLSLTAYMVGMALGQFLLGPLSDVLGRRRLMIGGNLVFLLASLGIVLAPGIGLVLALRLLQGIAGAAGVVIARAVVSDIARGHRAAQLYSVLSLITSLAPVVAPLAGGVIATVADWRTAFVVLTGFGAVMLACSVFVIPETLPRGARSTGGVGRILRNAGRVVGDRPFTLYALSFAFAFGALFSYISASSFVIRNVLGFSALGYSVVFALNACGSITTGVVNTKLVGSRAPESLLLTGVAGLAVFSVLNLALVLLGVVGIPTLVLIFLAQSCMGFVLGNAVALAQRRAQARGLSGTGAAVVGTAQFVMAGLVTPLTGLGGEFTAVPMLVCMAGCAAVSLLLALAARK
ncbi:multidrug effflux MFS transporter [Kocuria tytonis]|uniref:Bcr/CflA family efflux MFS transporter n=1 Tax=Kocuria tytonis TaxID=2054280 RepID=A0A495A521_9MICC|nr:multidrug effflux MFS transporter [Kocuria tytonis]RKQ34831.1 Bcr/CflA family efflux MFS transporter [Kocuria tytonis]